MSAFLCVTGAHVIVAEEHRADDAPEACEQTVTLFRVTLELVLGSPSDVLRLTPSNPLTFPAPVAEARLGHPASISYKATERCARYDVSADDVLAVGAYRVAVEEFEP